MSVTVGPLPRTIRTSVAPLLRRRTFQFVRVGVAVVLCCCYQLSAEDKALKADLERAFVGKPVVSKIVFGSKAKPSGQWMTYPVNTLVYPDGERVIFRVESGTMRTNVGPREMKQQFDKGTSFKVTAVDLKDDRLELQLETDKGDAAKLKLMLGAGWQSKLDAPSVRRQLAGIFLSGQEPEPREGETTTQPLSPGATSASGQPAQPPGQQHQAEIAGQPSTSDTTSTLGQQTQREAGGYPQYAAALEAQYRTCAKHYIPADKCTPEIYRQLKEKDNAALAARDKLPADSGMYYQSGGNYRPMKMDCNTGLKSTGLSFGLRDKFIYKGPSAPMRLNDHHPIFVFISPADTSAVRSTFVLVQMNMKKDHRETEFAVGGVLNNLVEVKVTHEASDITITPVADLAPGEYLLGMYQGASDATVANLLGCGYDFSVK
jgi:hypothetical protein